MLLQRTTYEITTLGMSYIRAWVSGCLSNKKYIIELFVDKLLSLWLIG